MAYVKIQPPGVVPILDEDRKPVIRVISGDTWTVSVNLYNPSDENPATPDNTLVRVVLSENQFEDPIWAGSWYCGVFPDKNRNGLCQIRIPRKVTQSLRRGSYAFSVRVTDLLTTTYATEAQGNFLVEYTPTSDQHSIPYKDNTMENAVEVLELTRDIESEFDEFRKKFDFDDVRYLTQLDSLKNTKDDFNKLLEVLRKVNA